MIGQKNLLQDLELILPRFPRFCIITGARGSGKKTLCKEISDKLKFKLVSSGIKIDDIRKTIDTAYTQVDNIAYLIPDADDMSLGAKNCLLKVTEEPPRNSYFFMTLKNLDNTLETIKSRATVFSLDDYSQEELLKFRIHRGYKDIYDNIIKEVCSTTGEVDEIFSYDVEKFYNVCKNVVDNIQVPTNGNAFKISKLIKTKNEDLVGYDANLFFNTVRGLFLKKAKELNKKEYAEASIITSKAMQELRNPSVNKLAVCDVWIMNVRSVLRGR